MTVHCVTAVTTDKGDIVHRFGKGNCEQCEKLRSSESIVKEFGRGQLSIRKLHGIFLTYRLLQIFLRFSKQI